MVSSVTNNQFVLGSQDGWQIIASGPTYNQCDILPINDQIEHELGDECLCGVTTEAVKNDDGEVNWLYTHYALDGRKDAP